MLPLSLYIHIPWCVKKCPYCDFNSHRLSGALDETTYIDALIQDLNQDLAQYHGQSKPALHSIFIGGGTPSLLSARAYERLLGAIFDKFQWENGEVTLEANPGTVEQSRFKAYREVGINRLSLGIQSFDDMHLKRLGRIHDSAQAHKAIDAVRTAGFDNFNLDIMHGLPQQNTTQGLDDLHAAIQHAPTHLSWYQLTIEPNTVFYRSQPSLPAETVLEQLEVEGMQLLKDAHFERYEISAYAKPEKQCAHNLNYWQFGDYLAIGAGAHAKLSTADGILRWQKYRQPNEYLNPNKAFTCSTKYLTNKELLFEFMLNATRLERAVPVALIRQRTTLESSSIRTHLESAQRQGLIELSETHFRVTLLGRRFTNDLQLLFMP